MFARWFEIEEWRATAEEGRALLTPDVRRELGQYSERELLTKGFLVRGVVRPTPLDSKAATQ
jgi:hypothetical protein